jgi:hypothetical protein
MTLVEKAMQKGEWDFTRAAKVWTPQTKAVQHVGVPGYQWQTAVLWNGSVGFGPFGFRKTEEFPGARIEKLVEAFGQLGNNRMHLSFAYGSGAKFFDFAGRGGKGIKRGLEEGRLPIPHVVVSDGGLVWEEVAYAHLLGRAMEDGMSPRPDDVLVTHVVFAVRNEGAKAKPARLWMHFGDASQVWFGYKLHVGNGPGPSVAHSFEAPFGTLEGKVRYVLPEPSEGQLVFHDEAGSKQFTRPLERVIEWRVDVEPGGTARMELALPYSAVDKPTAQRILAIDSEKALADARAYWLEIVKTGNRISVPDTFVDDYAAATAGQMAQQTAYRHLGGVWMQKTSPNHYEIYWPVSGGRALPSFDLRGLSQFSRPSLQSFLDVQSDDMGTLLREFRPGKGDVVAGEGFEKHDGFMGSFPGWTPNVLILNHAMGLWALASHYRITRDDKWLGGGKKTPLEGMLKAVDWIVVQRKRTKHEDNGVRAPHWGLMPPSAAHDWLSGSVIFNDAFCIFALIETVRMLREINHPRAEEIAAELTDYRKCLKNRYMEARDKATPLTLDDGTTIPFVPRDVTELDWKTIDWTYTSYGPLRAGAWGAIDPDDELMDQTLAFIEAGIAEGEINTTMATRMPMDEVDFKCWEDACFEGPRRYFWKHFVEYEIMWPLGSDLFLQRDDLERHFEWFFNALQAQTDKDYRIGAESLNGAPGCTPGDAERWQAVRNLFVNERGGYDGSQQSLWLLQAIPQAWLTPGAKMGVTKMGTHFGGTVDVSVEVTKDGNSCSVTAGLDLAVTPTEIRMRLRSADGRPLKAATIDGRPAEVLEKDTIRLPRKRSGRYAVTGAW